MNEGCATFGHHTMVNTPVQPGADYKDCLMEFLHATLRGFQPPFTIRRYYSINPYALGFRMMSDIRRIVPSPTEEDHDWFPQIRRTPWLAALRRVGKFGRELHRAVLSPNLIRVIRLFAVFDKAEDDGLQSKPFTTSGISETASVAGPSVRRRRSPKRTFR